MIPGDSAFWGILPLPDLPLGVHSASSLVECRFARRLAQFVRGFLDVGELLSKHVERVVGDGDEFDRDSSDPPSARLLWTLVDVLLDGRLDVVGDRRPLVLFEPCLDALAAAVGGGWTAVALPVVV